MAKNPNITKLDYPQVLKRVFNEDDDTLRTDTQVTISGDIEVAISADSGDNISLANADGSKFVDVETVDGKNGLDVNIIGGSITAENPSVGLNDDAAPTSSTQIGAVDSNGDLKPLHISDAGRLIVDAGQIFGLQNLNVSYNEENSVAVGVETTVNTYTAPIGVTSYLLSILVSGENRAQFNIYNNGALFDRQYTNVTQLTAPFDYKTGSGSVPGMVIPTGNTIAVKVVNSGTSTATYNARFMILEVT